jgi:hypothetical protein
VVGAAESRGGSLMDGFRHVARWAEIPLRKAAA